MIYEARFFAPKPSERRTYYTNLANTLIESGSDERLPAFRTGHNIAYNSFSMLPAIVPFVSESPVLGGLALASVALGFAGAVVRDNTDWGWTDCRKTVEAEFALYAAEQTKSASRTTYFFAGLRNGMRENGIAYTIRAAVVTPIALAIGLNAVRKGLSNSSAFFDSAVESVHEGSTATKRFLINCHLWNGVATDRDKLSSQVIQCLARNPELNYPANRKKTTQATPI